MNEALAWIGRIAEWIGQWIPRWMILEPTMGAVKYVRGVRVVPLSPGIHFWWPVTTKVDTYPTANQTDELRSQTIVTASGQSIDVSALLRYQVHDVALLCSRNYQPRVAIADVSLAAIHDVCCDLSWSELLAEQRKGTLRTKLRNAVKKELLPMGVSVTEVSLTDMAPCRVLKLKQSTRTDGEI